MRFNPISLIAVIVGLAVKWLILLAAGLFIHDMIQLKRRRHGRNS